MNKKELFGSEIAKSGFRNEDDVIEKFNNWKRDRVAQEWLVVMGYIIKEIEYARAIKVSGNYKTDVQVQVTIKINGAIDCENLSVKLLRDPRRMFLTEMNSQDQNRVINFFEKNKILIISDILKGRDKFAADWMLVILKKDNKGYEWALKDINTVMNIFGQGNVRITEQGSLKIGEISMQRKGGDAGRESAKMLQFKINPCLLFGKN